LARVVLVLLLQVTQQRRKTQFLAQLLQQPVVVVALA
jgi:hypothetical protein